MSGHVRDKISKDSTKTGIGPQTVMTPWITGGFIDNSHRDISWRHSPASPIRGEWHGVGKGAKRRGAKVPRSRDKTALAGRCGSVVVATFLQALDTILCAMSEVDCFVLCGRRAALSTHCLRLFFDLPVALPGSIWEDCVILRIGNFYVLN